MVDPLDLFRAELMAAGQPVDDILADGRIHRYDVQGCKRGRKPAWYICHLLPSGHIVARYGDWRITPTQEFTSWEKNPIRISEEEVQRYRRELADADKKAKAQRAREAKEATDKAVDEWPKLSLIGASAYLVRKGIKAVDVRFGRDERGAYIAVPMRHGADWRGIQRIYEDGVKRFTRGCEKRGSYALIGQLTERGPVYVVEGYATGVTVHLATGCLVVVCFDAWNVLAVLHFITKDMPYKHRLVVAADNDCWGQVNTGAKIASEVRYQYGLRTCLPNFDGWDVSSQPTDFNDLLLIAGQVEVERQLRDDYERERSANAATRRRFTVVRAGQDTELPTTEYLVEDYLPLEGLGFFYGLDQTFKSFILLDLMLCVATGRDWHGHPVKQSPVVYIAGEGQAGIALRIMAWCLHNLGQKTLPEGTPFYRSEEAAALCEGGNISEVTSELARLKEEHGRIGLVGIDTYSRNVGGAKESSPDDARLTLNLAYDHIVRAFGTAVMFVHHVGHADHSRMRGSSTFERDTDWRFLFDRPNIDSRLITMSCGKLKDLEIPPPLAFELELQELPFEKRPGVPLTSLVPKRVELGTVPTAVDNAAERGERNKTLPHQLFDEAVTVCARRTIGNLRTQGREIPVDLMVSVEEVRAAFKRGYVASGRGSTDRLAWKRVWDEVVAQEVYTVMGGKWLKMPSSIYLDPAEADSEV